jgi:hypothetical protein
VYKNLGQKNPAPLGELIRLSKTEALRKDARLRQVVEGWNLLGDPALRLPSARTSR